MRRKLRETYRDLKHGRLGVPYVEVRPSDCFLTSFPRSGNTWMRYMLLYTLYPGREWDIDAIEQVMPIIDRPDLTKILRERPADDPVRLFKSHDACRDYFLKGKVVYIIRDGRDAVCSYYHYRANLNEWDITLSQYVQRSLNGEYRYGSWHDHVRGWWERRENPRLLTLRYEAMLADPPTAVARVFDHFEIDVDREAFDDAVERASVEHVSKGFAKFAAIRDRQFTGGTGGGSGKWKAQLSAADIDRFNEKAGDLLGELGYDE